MIFTYSAPLEKFLSTRTGNKNVEDTEQSINQEINQDIITATAQFSGIMVFFFLGFCIYCVRENGFTYYTRYVKMKREKHPQNNGIILPGPIQRILFYVFRKGSVVEECCDNVKTKYEKIRATLERTDLTKRQRKFFTKILEKENRTFYPWIQKSQDPVKDLRVLARKIDIKMPECRIYEFFSKSQIYQGLDTGSLLLTAICILSSLVNMILTLLFSWHLPVILPLIMGIIPFILHLISKKLSAQKANMYIGKIDAILAEHPGILNE